jgi:hypothetical protein
MQSFQNVGKFAVQLNVLLPSKVEWHKAVTVVESSWNVMAHGDARERK